MPARSRKAGRTRRARSPSAPSATARYIWERTHPLSEPIAALYAAARALLPARAAVVGGYAYAAVVGPRETPDLDVLMPRRSAIPFAKRLSARVAGATWAEAELGLEVRLHGVKALDVIVAEHPVLRRILRGPLVERAIPRFGRARTPTVEGLVVATFLAAMGPSRPRTRRYRDVADLLFFRSARRTDCTSLRELVGLLEPSAEEAFWRILRMYDDAPHGPVVLWDPLRRA